MKVVYIAGPFTAETDEEIYINICAAEQAAYSAQLMGLAALCPHSIGRSFVGTHTPEYWYEATLEMMRRCDAVFLVDGWEDSEGTILEIGEAGRLGIPVFGNLNKLDIWSRK
jgi:nucleoside 2-deoxyribosyltransferase